MTVPMNISGSLEIRVSNMGIWIVAKDVPKIFDRLYPSDESRSTKGSGLGLSLVKALAQAHRGRILVESKPGNGSGFIHFFPRAAV